MTVNCPLDSAILDNVNLQSTFGNQKWTGGEGFFLTPGSTFGNQSGPGGPLLVAKSGPGGASFD